MPEEHKYYEQLEQQYIFKRLLYKKYPWLREFEDVHPRDIVRSNYFTRAAEELRRQQNV